MKLKLILFIAFFSTGWSYAHKFYVSITNLEYNVEKDRIEGVLKLTAHDFEHILENKFDQEIIMENVVDSSAIGRYMQAYLADHIALYSGGKKAVPNYLGKEVTLRQELFFYFTFSGVVNPAEIELKSTLLFELFTEQQNIIHYRYKGTTKSVTLVVSQPNGKIKFD